MEIIEQLLSSKFEEFRTVQGLWAMITIIVLIVIQIGITFWLNKKLSKYNSRLQRSEFKFSKFHTDQIEAYKMLFKHVYNYRVCRNLLVNANEDDLSHDNYKRNLSNWISSINALVAYFRENRIFFEPDTIRELEKDIKLIYKFAGHVVKERKSIEDFEIDFAGDFIQMYGSDWSEVSEIRDRLKKLKESEEYNESRKRIINIATHVEEMFRRLTA